MIAFFLPVAVGAVLIFLGISNMKGDISSIHEYHRQRVTEEDKAAFGKLMGLGTIFCGVSVVLFGLLSLAAELTGQYGYMTVGSILMPAGLAVGIGILIYTTIKYNKGIF